MNSLQADVNYTGFFRMAWMTFPKGKPARSPKQWQIYGGDAADTLLEETDQKINALLPFPQEHPVVEDKLLAAWGVHFIQIKNYFAFYIVEGNQVTVIRFLYAKSDRVSILKTGFPLVQAVIHV